MSYVTTAQLQDIAEMIRQAITDGATDLSQYSAVLNDPITIDQLNTGDHLKNAKTLGIRVVKNSSGNIIGMTVQFGFLAYVSELFIGLTDSEGDVDSLSPVTVAAYAKQPGLSIAIRYDVTFSYTLDKNVVSGNGMSKWHVMQLADYSGFLAALGGVPGSCSCKTWKGSQTQYDALASKDPDTIYYITES